MPQRLRTAILLAYVILTKLAVRGTRQPAPTLQLEASSELQDFSSTDKKYRNGNPRGETCIMLVLEVFWRKRKTFSLLAGPSEAPRLPVRMRPLGTTCLRNDSMASTGPPSLNATIMLHDGKHAGRICQVVRVRRNQHLLRLKVCCFLFR